MKFSACTYNIHRCVGTDGCKDIDRVLSVLSEINADIIALQEVESLLNGGTNENQASYFAEKLGMNLISGPTLLKPDEHYGNALLVKHTIHTVEHHDISLPRREPRAAVDVLLDMGEEKTLRVINTHLGLKRKERHLQTAKLLDLIQGSKNGRILLLGDFNSWQPIGGTTRRLDKELKMSLKHSSPRTYPSRFPTLALDRIWMRPPEAVLKMAAYKTPLARKASDHLPLMAFIRI